MKINRLIIVFGGIFLFLLPSFSYAVPAFEVDTYGNGQFIGEVLNSVAILAGGGDLNGLLRLGLDRKSTRLNSSHSRASRMPSSA